MKITIGAATVRGAAGSGNASNGLSVDPVSGDYVLGNDVGDPADPAQLLNDREITMFGNFIQLRNPITNIISQINNQRWYMEDPGPPNVTNTFRPGSIEMQDLANTLLTRIILGRIDLENTQDIHFRCAFLPGPVTADFFADANGGGFRLNMVPRGVYVFAANGNCVIGSYFPYTDNGARLQVLGNMTVGGTIATASAKIHVTAGAAGAGTAPFKYTAGVLAQTVVENGAKNFDGSNESIAAGGVTYTLAKTLTATAVLDFPNTAAQTSSDLTIALTGAALGDIVLLGVPNGSVTADSCYTAFVSAANTVTVRYNNYSAGAQDPGSGTFRVSIVKY